MKTGKEIQKISRPDQSIIYDPSFGTIHYEDAYATITGAPRTADEALNIVFGSSGWGDTLMRVRDNIVRFFGLKPSEKQEQLDYYSVGSKAIIFSVVSRNENEIVMAEADKHLNFRTSVLVVPVDGGTQVVVSTLVHYNNVGGRIYFFFIRLFHSLLIRSSLKKIHQ